MNMTNKKYLHEDITDSAEDEEKLKPDHAVMDLPEIKDIPGASRSGKNALLFQGDITISSADEEGDDLLEDSELPNENEGLDDGNVSPIEKKLLKDSFDPSYDSNLPVDSISLDDKDNESESLEEAGQAKDLFGNDLDDNLIEEEDEESEGENQQ
jgi:hypothetical protein